MSPESTSHVINSPRRLVAILLADISGYSRLMGSDEEGIHARIKRHRREIVEPTIQEHYGRLIRYTGDGFLAIFESPLEAVRCAIVIQQSMAARNLSLPKNHWIRYRIGVNLGDVIVEEDDVYGEGVNIAARLEALADPGGVYISGGVYEQVKNKLVCGYQSLGDERLKNITDPVRVYRVLPDPAAVSGATRKRRGWEVPAAAAALLLAVGTVGWYLATSAQRRPAPEIATTAVPTATAPEARAPEVAAPPAAAGDSAATPAPNTQTAIAIPPKPVAKPAEARPGAFRDCQDCPDMVRLAAGAFRMGSSEDPSEGPIRTVQVAAFALSRAPVTVGEWKACSAAKACDFEATGDDGSPVLNVSWYDAQQYADWLAKDDRPALSPAERGGVGIRRPRRHRGPLLVGRQGRPEHGELPGLQRAVQRQAAREPGPLSAEPVRPRRHDRQRRAMGRRLLASELPGRARRRLGSQDAELPRERAARRFVAKRRDLRALGEPGLLRHGGALSDPRRQGCAQPSVRGESDDAAIGAFGNGSRLRRRPRG